VLPRPSRVPELRQPRESPEEYVRRLAREKARAIPGEFVLGADTVVVVDGEVLEKPRDREDALRMLLLLQGRRHQVTTGVCLVAHGREYAAVDNTAVYFRPAGEALLRAYVATGEPMDKAGAYGIQGYGAALVERIEGDFFAVMGLPIARMLTLFRSLGWSYNFRGFEKLA